ncbi:hypothetical protein BK635_23085 [Pseudomonas chlororaphis]|uniref:hypothetical protein n=1 Tax=Pseudomonas chlororaphis TaxID=587753 RepID=UPI000F485F27|nr:hypothetical protein [Pseudomonas chlororaphis]RON76543.1 hypothetical protein BK635_23085 [Pseudomonas chlororaphis]
MPSLEAVSSRADVWNVANTHCRVHYQLVTEAEADVLCRVLNHFALQSLLPQQVQVQQQDGSLLMEVLLDGLSWHRAQVIAEKLRNLISVCSVQLQLAEREPLQAAG